jgi:inner membrane protein
MWPGGVGAVRLWAYPVLLAAVALGFGEAERRVEFDLWSTGLLDEISHLATAALGLLVLACLVDLPRRCYAAALIASVAIDLDHIPDYLGLLGDQAQRPFTHSLATVAVFAVAAAAVRRYRAVLAGAAAGLVLHFARDIAEGPPGVRMLWPLQETAWTASYWWFVGMIAVFTGVQLLLAQAGVPHVRPRLFQAPSRPHEAPRRAAVASDDPDAEPERRHRPRSSLAILRRHVLGRFS